MHSPPRRASPTRKLSTPLLMTLSWLCAVAGGGCTRERWDPGPYRFCETDGQCRSNESCIHVRSTAADGGAALAGVCTTACTLSTLAQSVYFGAGSRASTCVGIDATGGVDTTTLGLPGWYLRACGSDHYNAGATEYRIVCTPFDYAGYPIDLWIPTP